MRLDLPPLKAVMREVWTRDMWLSLYGVVLVEWVLDADLPVLVLRDPTSDEREGEWGITRIGEPDPKYTHHAVDLTDWFYGPERFFRSIDRQFHEAAERHHVLEL